MNILLYLWFHVSLDNYYFKNNDYYEDDIISSQSYYK